VNLSDVLAAGGALNTAQTLSGLTNGFTIGIADTLSAVLTASVTGAAASASDSLTVVLTESANTDYTSIAVADVETLTIDVTETTPSAANTRAATLGIANSATAVASGGSGAAQTVNIIGTESLTIDTAIAAATINASGMGARATTIAGLTMGAAFTATATIPGQTITGSGGIDVLRTSTGTDTVNGGAGNDTIHGSVKGDSIDGGAGTGDTYATSTTQVGVVAEGAGTGTTTGLVINLGSTALTNANVLATTNNNLSGTKTSVASGEVAYLFGASLTTNSAVVDTLSNIENVTLAGNGVNYVVGSDSANVITGGTGVDTISGGKGDDTITGGAGADVMIGGAGADDFVIGATDSLNTALDKLSDYTAASDDLDLVTVPTALVAAAAAGNAGAADLVAAANYVSSGTTAGTLATDLAAIVALQGANAFDDRPLCQYSP
jgi:Ca2+-binding RTX toxin-like protein